MNDLRCLKCGIIVVGGEALQELCDKITDEKGGLAKFMVKCPKCKSKFGVVVGTDFTGAIVLMTPPERTNDCLIELKEMLETGLTVVAIAAIVNHAKASEYISFL
jgi:hypothetical protein